MYKAQGDPCGLRTRSTLIAPAFNSYRLLLVLALRLPNYPPRNNTIRQPLRTNSRANTCSPTDVYVRLGYELKLTISAIEIGCSSQLPRHPSKAPFSNPSDHGRNPSGLLKCSAASRSCRTGPSQDFAASDTGLGHCRIRHRAEQRGRDLHFATATLRTKKKNRTIPT